MSKTEYGVWITDDAGNRTLWNKDAVADGKGTHLGTIDGVRCYTLPAVCGFFLSVPLIFGAGPRSVRTRPINRYRCLRTECFCEGSRMGPGLKRTRGHGPGVDADQGSWVDTF